MNDGIVDAPGLQLLGAHAFKAGDALAEAPAQGHMAGGVFVEQGIVEQNS